MKKIYSSPEIELSVLDEDVILASGLDNNETPIIKWSSSFTENI